MTTLNPWIMIVVLLAALGFFAHSIRGRIMLLAAGKPDARFDQIKKRLGAVVQIAIAQRKMFKEPIYGLMHALIFWGFLVLLVRSLVLIVMAFSPEFMLPGVVGQAYTFSKDVVEAIVLAMVLYAAYRRLFNKPKRITASTEGLLILALIGGLMVTDFLFDGARFAAFPSHPEAAHSPVGALVGGWLSSMGTGGLKFIEVTSYWAHIGILFGFLNLLPHSKHMHVLTSIPNVFFTKLEPRGKLSDMNLEDESIETFGSGRAEDLTWKQMLDLYTCTECGRCEVNCPAWQSDKPLNPKLLIKDLQEHLLSAEDRLMKRKTDAELPPTTEDGESKMILAVNEDVIWSCTTCRSCEENCPVMINHVDKIVDMRRYLVLTEARFPKELNSTLRNIEQKGNPWGLATNARAKWTSDDDLEGIEIPHISDKPDAEYVFWVGCAGAYDDRQRKVTKALAKILHRANISFAILGTDESCTGDPARRLGNEYLFQTLAQTNVEVLNGFNVRKILTHCPHCLNTMLNEYPTFGGKYEVVHHSQLIAKLVADGKITPAKSLDKTITYHDSCYLGRYNDVYEEPRNVVASIPGTKLVEMDRNRQSGMCCGAGGSRIWMEERLGKRVNHLRVEQAMEKKPDLIASACPFCLTMVRDGIADKGVGDKIEARDIAELVADSIH